VDEYIPEPKREMDKPFMMSVRMCSRSGARHGGDGARGSRQGEDWGAGGDHRVAREEHLFGVTGVEMFHKSLDEGMAGDNLGLLLRGIEREDVERGR